MRHSPPPFQLPDPYIQEYPYSLIFRIQLTVPMTNGAVTSVTNRAVYVPMIFPCDATLYAIRFVATNGTGNYDLGFYKSDLTRIASSGITAMTAAGVKSLTLSEVRVFGGDLYYSALWLSSTSGQVIRYANTATVTTLNNLGFAQETNAAGLPATATPATQSDLPTPQFFYGVR